MSEVLFPTKVLVIGATGYIGGAVLHRLLEGHPEFEFSALVRNPKDNGALEKIGVRVVNGSTEDHELVQQLARENDVVVNCADADDLKLVQAIFKGLPVKPKIFGRTYPFYIHTSGTGVVGDSPTGEFNHGTSEKIWNDNVVEDIKSIGPKQPHREVDLAIFEASEQHNVDGYIVAPSTIYGKGRGPVRNVSQQIPQLIRDAIKAKQAVYVGKGTNIWNNVHVDDLADLYLLVFNHALSAETRWASYANFFWGSVGEHQWGKLVSEIGDILYKKKKLDTPEPRSVTLDEFEYLIYTANNSRTVSERGVKQLGWKPSRPSLEHALEDEIDLVLSKY